MPDASDTLSVADAYLAMFAFLDQYWREGSQKEEQIAVLLSSMQFSDKLGPTKTIDPAMWEKWLESVEMIGK